jgi:hypothetical protein
MRLVAMESPERFRDQRGDHEECLIMRFAAFVLAGVVGIVTLASATPSVATEPIGAWAADTTSADPAVASSTAAVGSVAPGDSSGMAPLPPATPGRRPLSPGAATFAGLGATIAPMAVATALVAGSLQFTGEVPPASSLTAGALVLTGFVAGPAVGLWSGGRGDLARSGLIVRGVSGLAVGLGVIALGRSWESTPTPGESASMMLGGAGALVLAGSFAWDMLRTPFVTGSAKAPPRVAFGVLPDGKAAVRVRF